MRTMLSRVELFTLLAILTSTLTYAQPMVDENLLLHLESAHIIGTGSTIIIHRMPLTNSITGEIVQKDITIDLAAGEDGVIFVNGFTEMNSVPLDNRADNILPGIYESEDPVRFSVSVGGTTADGRTSGSIRSITESIPFSATWVTGPPQGHPIIGNFEIVPELPIGPTYGLMGNSRSANYCQGRVIAVSQIGESLVFTAYHQNNGTCPAATDASFGVSSFTMIPVREGTTP